MSTSIIRQNNSCTTCRQAAGVFTCRGCSKVFCLNHTNEHRRMLEKEMNGIILSHDHLKRHITSEQADQYYQRLLEDIDQWERQSIEIIRHTAADTREQLAMIRRENYDHANEKLTQLYSQLTKAQYDGGFFENELKQWKHSIDKLRHNLLKQENIEISSDNCINPFISKISIIDKTDETLRSSIKYPTNKTNGKQIEKYKNLTIQDKYSSGDHLLRFRLQIYEPNCLVLMGIISQSISRYSDPYRNPTFHGWSTDDSPHLSSIVNLNCNRYQGSILRNDVFQLLLDCDQKFIRLTNQRTNYTCQLRVDIARCPFPWQVHVRILSYDTRIVQNNLL